jgi:hypothetical protein
MVFAAICQLFSCYFLFVFRTFGKQVTSQLLSRALRLGQSEGVGMRILGRFPRLS